MDTGPGFELSIRHPDLDILREATADLENQLRSYETLYDIHNDLEGASEEIRLTMKPGTTKLGLTLAEVNRQVRQAYFGEEVQRLARDGQDVKVKVRYPLASRRSIESLQNFRVRTSDGRELPLLSVADLEYAPGISRIQRWNGNRAARVSADLKENVRDDIMKDLDENFFPDWEKRYPGHHPWRGWPGRRRKTFHPGGRRALFNCFLRHVHAAGGGFPQLLATIIDPCSHAFCFRWALSSVMRCWD